MALLPSVPSTYSCGIFAYHDFKIFIAPTEPSIVYFTGLHRHGGTAPAPLSGQKAVKWAYRLSVICYPNGPTLRGESRHSLAPFSGFDVVKKDGEVIEKVQHKAVLKLPPEIRRRERYLFCPP